MIPNYFGSGVLFQLVELWNIFAVSVSTLYDILSTPLKSLFDLIPGFSDIPILGDALDFILDVIGLGGWSLLSVMFGGGLLAYVVLVVVKFVVGLFGGD